MKYGFILTGDPLSVVELAQEAEEAGWDGVSRTYDMRTRIRSGPPRIA